MSGAVIDLAAVARVRRELETIVATHAHIAGTDAQARVSQWIYAQENEPMSRPLDPENTDSLALTMRITRPLADALDAELARFTAQNPGVSASRATIARIALMRVFMSSGNVLASASAPAPVAPVAPAAPAPVARVERVERASPAAPAVALVPVVDTRQGQLPITATVASVAPMSESAYAHMSLRDRYHHARSRHGFKHADAERALADAGVPVKNLCRELAKPTAKWTAAHAAALTAMLDNDDGTSWYAPSEPSADADALAHANEALRVHYRAGLAAKRITPREVWEALGDKSESTLRMWASGKSKKASAERLDAIKRVLNAKRVTA